jgi:hypothetical protein
MPVVPLYDPSPLPPASPRRMSSPGGYEVFRWQAFDPARRIFISIAFWQGYSFHPKYRAAYRQFLARPTRTAPPTPDQFPCLTITVVENETALIHLQTCLTQNSPMTMGASEIKHADDLVRSGDHGSVIELNNTSLVATLKFAGPPDLTPRTISDSANRKHFWFKVQPDCIATGNIQLPNGRTLDFLGQGFSDHRFGTEPLGLDSSAWMQGALSNENPSTSFEITAMDEKSPVARLMPPSCSEAIPLHPSIQFRRTLVGTNLYPRAIDMLPEFLLRDPHPIHLGPRSTLLLYDAFVEGKKTRAMVEAIRIP